MRNHIFFIAAVAILAFGGCKKSAEPVTPQPSGDKITIGTSVDAGSSVIGSAGGSITVTRPSTPLDGMTITIPPNAYPDTRTFLISYAPIESHQFGADFVPITPLIMIRNGGGYAQHPMQVRIPVHISSDQFALGFFYNENTKTLEAMGLVDQDSVSITVESRHFDASGISGSNAKNGFGPHIQDGSSIANIVVTVIDRARLMAMSTISSGFSPGVDDWEFVNLGSFLAPGGHCAGESMTAMWYYYERKPIDKVNLYHAFDRVNRSKYVLWQDNRQGYAWASAVQCDFNWNDWIARVTLAKGHGPENLLAFAFSMLVTHEPQFVLIRNSVDHGGHAMVVYAVSPSEGVLYIADPNKPGDKTARITMAGGVFQPYTTGLRADGTPVDFDQIGWFAKTSYITWNQITTRYNQFAAGTIRDLVFPPYTWWVKDGSGYELVDGLNTDADSLPLEIRNYNPALFTKIGFIAYDTAGTVLNNLTGSVTLHSGKNVIGLNIVGEPARECDGTVPTNHDYQWVDFKWYTVYRQMLEIGSMHPSGAPFDAPGSPDSEYVIYASSAGTAPPQPRYVWDFGDGTEKVTVVGDSTVSHTWTFAGTATVTVELFNNANGTFVGSATAAALIGSFDDRYSITTFSQTGTTGTIEDPYAQSEFLVKLAQFSQAGVVRAFDAGTAGTPGRRNAFLWIDSDGDGRTDDGMKVGDERNDYPSCDVPNYYELVGSPSKGQLDGCYVYSYIGTEHNATNWFTVEATINGKLVTGTVVFHGCYYVTDPQNSSNMILRSEGTVTYTFSATQ